MPSVVVSDASTVIGLLNVNSLDLLKTLYAEIFITSIVRDEIAVDLPEWVHTDDTYDNTLFQSLRIRLDDGEASSIALAASRTECLLIIDEKKGRREAMHLRIQITGVVGVIMRAKEKGIVESGKILLDELIESRFRISAKVYRLALRNMDEAGK